MVYRIAWREPGGALYHFLFEDEQEWGIVNVENGLPVAGKAIKVIKLTTLEPLPLQRYEIQMCYDKKFKVS
jgi:hypothetical protein